MEQQRDNEAAYLRIEGVNKRFGDNHVVKDVSLEIARKEIFALLGSSGCGKSTVAHAGGPQTPSAGRIVLDGEDLATVQPYRRPTNMMFQSHALFPTLRWKTTWPSGCARSARGSPAATSPLGPAACSSWCRCRSTRGASRTSSRAGSSAWPWRAASAKEPKLLLLDEPLAALDKKIRQRPSSSWFI